MAVLGFIGVGNMGGALARAAAKKVSGPSLLLANRSPEKAARLAAELGGQVSDNAAIAAEADFIFLGCRACWKGWPRFCRRGRAPLCW